MNVSQMLEQTGAVEAISRELGVDSATAQAGATALLPSILSGFQEPGGSSGGASVRSAFLAGLGAWGDCWVDRTAGGRRTPRQCHLERADASSQRQ